MVHIFSIISLFYIISLSIADHPKPQLDDSICYEQPTKKKVLACMDAFDRKFKEQAARQNPTEEVEPNNLEELPEFDFADDEQISETEEAEAEGHIHADGTTHQADAECNNQPTPDKQRECKKAFAKRAAKLKQNEQREPFNFNNIEVEEEHDHHDDSHGHDDDESTARKTLASSEKHDNSDGHHKIQKKEPIYTGFSPTDALMKRFITVAMCHVFLIILGIIGLFIRKNYGPIKLLKGPESPKKESKQTVLKTPESKQKSADEESKIPEVIEPVVPIQQAPQLLEEQPQVDQQQHEQPVEYVEAYPDNQPQQEYQQPEVQENNDQLAQNQVNQEDPHAVQELPMQEDYQQPVVIQEPQVQQQPTPVPVAQTQVIHKPIARNNPFAVQDQTPPQTKLPDAPLQGVEVVDPLKMIDDPFNFNVPQVQRK